MKIPLFARRQCASRGHSLPLLGLVAAALVASWSSRISAAEDSQSVSRASPSEERLRVEIRELMLRMVESGTLTPESSGASLSIDEPARQVTNLGLLVDSASGARAQNGLHVLGTTPGSNGVRMGLRSGDILLSVNQSSLAGLGDAVDGGARAAQLLREIVDGLGTDGSLSFEVLRGNQRITLGGEVKSVAIPAMQLKLQFETPATQSDAPANVSKSECGRISVLDIAPRSDQLHAATIVRIDGKTPGVSGQNAFRVAAGQHVLEVGELIESRYLSFNDRLRSAGRTYKKITIDVAPNTTYFIAARLIDAQRNQWKDGAYWETAIWKSLPESCR